VAALNRGVTFLRECRRLDPQAYERQHKGIPLYWLGIAAFLAHDFQTAVFLFDAAVSEDIRIGANPAASDSPALKFIYIRGDPPEQAARELVQKTESLVTSAISLYNKRLGATGDVLSVEEIRTIFLQRVVCSPERGLRTLATTLLSFFLEADHRSQLASLGLDGGTSEPFFTHLFKG